MNRLLQVKPYGSSSHISLNELGTAELLKIFSDKESISIYESIRLNELSFMPFLWRNYLYILTYHFAIYRIADKGKLA